MDVHTDFRIITLMYHRIERTDTNPWGICVSPDHFNEQIQEIKNNFPVIRAEDVIQKVLSGAVRETSVCITFDDGYADNYTHALPVLKKHQCPATFFIASAFIGNARPYWWDELEIICLHAKQLPEVLELSFNDVIHSFSFEAELSGQQWQQHLVWRWHEAAPTKRCHSFMNLWTLLRVLPYPEIIKRMNTIRVWAGIETRLRLPMNEQQLQSLSSEDLVTVGLHTYTHPNLARHKREVQSEEIILGKKALADHFKIESSMLAYPYGSFNETTISVVKDLRLTGCFTTEPTPVTTKSEPMKLSRYQVFDWDRQTFENQLREWISE